MVVELLLSLLPLAALIEEGPVPPVIIGVESVRELVFTWSGLYADGSAGATVSAVQFRYEPVTVGAPVLWTRVERAIVAGDTSVAVQVLVRTIPAGDYRLACRLIAPDGQVSDLSSPPLLVRVVTARPAAPTNLRLRVTVTLEGEVPR